MDTYKIISIDTNTGYVTVLFSIDNKQQILAGMPVTDDMALKYAINTYAKKYKAGLLKPSFVIPNKVQDLVGVEQEVS